MELDHWGNRSEHVGWDRSFPEAKAFLKVVALPLLHDMMLLYFLLKVVYIYSYYVTQDKPSIAQLVERWTVVV